MCMQLKYLDNMHFQLSFIEFFSARLSMRCVTFSLLMTHFLRKSTFKVSMLCSVYIEISPWNCYIFGIHLFFTVKSKSTEGLNGELIEKKKKKKNPLNSSIVLRPFQIRNLFLITTFWKVQWGMRFLFYYFFNFKAIFWLRKINCGESVKSKTYFLLNILLEHMIKPKENDRKSIY